MVGHFLLSLDVAPSSREVAHGRAGAWLGTSAAINRIARLLDGHGISATWYVDGAGAVDAKGLAGAVLTAVDGMKTPQRVAERGMPRATSVAVIKRSGPAPGWVNRLDLLLAAIPPVFRPEEFDLRSGLYDVPTSLIYPGSDLLLGPVAGWFRVGQIRRAIARAERTGAVLHVVISLPRLAGANHPLRVLEDVLFHVSNARAAGRLRVVTIDRLAGVSATPESDLRPVIAG